MWVNLHQTRRKWGEPFYHDKPPFGTDSSYPFRRDKSTIIIVLKHSSWKKLLTINVINVIAWPSKVAQSLPCCRSPGSCRWRTEHFPLDVARNSAQVCLEQRKLNKVYHHSWMVQTVNVSQVWNVQLFDNVCLVNILGLQVKLFRRYKLSKISPDRLRS